jgi:hypothetical protein
MNVRAGRLVVLIGQVVLGACGAGSGLSLYDTGEPVELDRSRSTTLRDQVKHHFGQCRPWQAVVVDGTLPQRELRELWRQQTTASYVLVEEGPAADAPFAHLRGLEYRLLLGLDSTVGVTPVLTEHNGLVTLYIKCPGLEGMELGCEIAHELSDGESWPVCRTVASRRRQFGG